MKRPPHRWFHALVVTGASLTACSGKTQEPGADASDDQTAPADAVLLDVATREAGDAAADTGNPVIIIDAGGPPSPEDARNDPRCCVITR